MDYKRVLILHFTNGMSSREIAEVTGNGKTTINEFLKREYSAPERTSRPDELSTVTAVVVQYIRGCCILCFCAFGAPGSARTRGLSLWVFQEGGRADAQGKRDATRKSPHQASHRRSCCFPTLYYPLPGVTTPLWESPLRHLSIFNGAVTLLNLAGDTARS